MIDSTARAERLEVPSTEPAFYTWEAAQKPVAVRLPLVLIDRLESEAVDTFRSLSSRGSEIGGLLLGSVAPGSPAVVTVAEFELVPCDYSRGPLYRLSEADLGRFGQAIEKHSSGAGPRVIGYFRSHTRKGLSLDPEDLAFFEPRFLEPQHVVLLIRPFATKASTAGIFIRENGKIVAEASYLEFPFRAAELAAASRGGEKSEPASPMAAAAAPTVAPKPQSRAQIVPIAPRREITLPEPVPAPQPAIPIVAERVEAPAPPRSMPAVPADKEKDKVVAPAPKTTPPANRPANADKVAGPAPPKSAPPANRPADADKVAGPASPKSAPTANRPADADKVAAPAPAEPIKPAPLAAPAAKSAPAAPAANKKLRLIVAAALGMLVLVGGMVLYPTLRNRIFPRHAAVQQDSSPLSLRVERTAGGMLLTWNRDLPVIQDATKVVLSISDGDRHENIQLDPNQVRTGSILYPPISGDVSFQMEVTDPHQSKTTSESLRVLDPRPSPLADPADLQAQGGAKANAAAKPAANGTSGTETAVAEESTPQEETPAPRAATPLKQFYNESLAQRLRPVASTDLPDAPSLARSGVVTPASLPGIEPSQPSLPPPPRPASPAAGAPSSAAPSGAAAQGGQLRPAQVISRVDPDYPPIARRAGAAGVVELEATIGVDGKVKNVHVTTGNSLLRQSAINAVSQWRYKPAVLNGTPVESPVEIKLTFGAH
jgi:TonB family protein